MSTGKHVAGNGWQSGGDPFADGNKKKKRSKGRGKRAGTIALCVILALALAAGGAWLLLVRRPDVSHNDRPNMTDKTQNPGGDGSSVDLEGDISGRKEDYFTFLLVGKDTGGGGNTDTLILVSYDVPSGQVNMMSIPRDTVVNVQWSTKKINSVYMAKESNGGGIENLKRHVGELTGVIPDFHVIIEWKAVGELVEAVNGVEFDVPRNMNYDDPAQDLHIHLTKGVQTLTGQQAMEMLRYRHDNDVRYGYGDTGRAETQRNFLKAMAKKVLQLQNMTKIGEFIRIFMDNVTTDLKLSDMMWFASKALSVDVDAINSSTMPYVDIGRFRGAYYFLADPEQTVPLINEQFNPYNRDITLDDLQVVQRNKDGSCYVTNGTLLDSRWAKAYSGGSSGSSSSSGSTGTAGTAPEETAPPDEGGGDPTDGETGLPTEDGDAPDDGATVPDDGGNIPADGTPGASGGEGTGDQPDEPAPPPVEPEPPAAGGDSGTGSGDSGEDQPPEWLQ